MYELGLLLMSTNGKKKNNIKPSVQLWLSHVDYRRKHCLLLKCNLSVTTGQEMPLLLRTLKYVLIELSKITFQVIN